MTRIIQSFSVPDGSVAHAKLKQWKDEGVNISAVVQMLIEQDGADMDHLERLKNKIRKLKDLTNHRKMTEEEWSREFMMW